MLDLAGIDRELVALGATAAQALLGRDFRVTQRHGEMMAADLRAIA